MIDFGHFWRTKYTPDVTLVYALIEQVPYILTGKLQTDNLESRFDQYQQFTSGKYSITITLIIKAQNNTRINSVLGVYVTLFKHI